MSNATKTAKRSDFKKYFQFMWRSLNIQASWNYERQMNMGFLYGIAPTLDELYPDENDPEQLAHKKEAYEREMAFYNCTCLLYTSYISPTCQTVMADLIF